MKCYKRKKVVSFEFLIQEVIIGCDDEFTFYYQIIIKV